MKRIYTRHIERLKPVRSSKGFTLLELIVSLAIAGIVLAMIFSLNLFGIRSFAVQDRQSSIQTDVRMAADAITREVRLANSVEMLSSVPGTFDPDYSYLYTQTANGVTSIILRDSSGARTVTSYTEATLTFSTEAPSRTLEFTISGILREQNFSLTSKVVPLNFPQDGSVIPNAGNGTALKFRKVVQIVQGTIAITNSLPNGYSGDPYVPVYFSAEGGTAPYNYTVSSGTVPDGLTLYSNGIISGTLGAPGIYEFTVMVQDSSNPVKSGHRTYYVIIGDKANSAAGVLSGIDVYSTEEPEEPEDPEDPPPPPPPPPLYPIYQPIEGQMMLVLPDNLPPGFAVVIVSTDPAGILGTDGTIYPNYGEEPVTAELWIKVINLIDPTDWAVNAEPFVIIVPPGTPNSAPSATNVNIIGQTTVGLTLTASYEYSDPESDPEGASIHQWYTSATGLPDDKIPVLGATSLTYTLTVSELGKVMYFGVTPVAVSGTPSGLPALSNPTNPVSQNQTPVTTNVAITGEPVRNKTLTGSYTYTDAENDPEGMTLLIWYRSDTVGGDRIQIGTGSTYRLEGVDVGKYVSFEVTPYALTGSSPGDPVIVTSVKVTQN